MSKPEAVYKDILIFFHLVMAIQTLGALCKKKVLSVLFNKSIVKNSSNCSGTKCN